MKEILLLSGGIDSTALAYSEEPEYAITVDYGQTAAKGEIKASRQICRELEIDHCVIEANCSDLGTGTMSDADQLEIASTPEWWPFRNQLIITLSAMKAVRLDAGVLTLGSVKNDREHADGRREFFELIDGILSIQEGRISVRAPAIDLTSAELVENSGIPHNILAWSHSCYRSENACGECRGCVKKEEALNSIR